MTRKDMSDEVQYWLGLQDIAAFDERTFIWNKLYQGTIDMLARTKCVARCLDLNVRAGVDQYILDHSVLALVDIENGDRRRARRDEQLSSPNFTLIRADVLQLEPAPDADGVIQTWAVLRPAQMANDTDSVGDEKYGAIPDEYQDAVVLYALWKCSDYSDDASAQMGERYRIQYEGQDTRSGRLGQIRSSVNKRGTARAASRRVRLSSVRPASSWQG